MLDRATADATISSSQSAWGGRGRAKKAEVCAGRCASPRVGFAPAWTRRCLAASASPNHGLTMGEHSASGSAAFSGLRLVRSIAINCWMDDTATGGLGQLSHSVEHRTSHGVWLRSVTEYKRLKSSPPKRPEQRLVPPKPALENTRGCRASHIRRQHTCT